MQSSAFQTDTTGELVHTGIQLSRAGRAARAPPSMHAGAGQQGAQVVASVMEGSAAERAGVVVGDKLLAINGRDAKALPDKCDPASPERHLATQFYAEVASCPGSFAHITGLCVQPRVA